MEIQDFGPTASSSVDEFIFDGILLKFHKNLSACWNSGGLKELWTSAPLHDSVMLCIQAWLSTQTVMGYFWPITVISESMFLLVALRCALVTGDIGMSWLAVETSDIP